MEHLVLIGAGQLGSRHLQSLKRLTRDVSIQVVEPNPRAVASARQRYSEVPDNPRIRRLQFLSSPCEVSGEVDLCIVATAADVRFESTRQLVERTAVRNILFEKVLFQRVEHYDAMNVLLAGRGIRGWVDCSKRYFPVYREIRDLVGHVEEIDISVTGGRWGLASNAIHFLDLMVFLTGATSYHLRTELVDPVPVPSKREGFHEFQGVLEAVFAATRRVLLSESRCSSAPYVVTIVTPEHYFAIDEGNGRLTSAAARTEWTRTQRDVSVPRQSDITCRIAESILERGECWLPDYRTSMETHLPFIRALLDRLGPAHQTLPIT